MAEHFDRRQYTLGTIVLVVCFIFLAGLLLPAVGSRESPHRTQCANSLKNLMLATLNFEGAKKSYPSLQGYLGVSEGRGKVGSWVVAVLPYIEQQPLADIWDDPSQQFAWEQAMAGDQKQVELFFPPIRLMQCPKDVSQLSPVATNSYAVNAGFYLLPNDPALTLASYAEAANDSERSTISQRVANGVFNNRLPPQVWDYQRKQMVNTFGTCKNKIDSSQIVDGLSHTLGMAENCHGLSWRDVSIDNDSARYKLGMVWLYAGRSTSEGRPAAMQIADAMRINGHKNDRKPVRPETARPSSFHEGVVVAEMLDGSTKTIDEGIDYHVYQALMTPDGAKSDMPDPGFKLKESDFTL